MILMNRSPAAAAAATTTITTAARELFPNLTKAVCYPTKWTKWFSICTATDCAAVATIHIRPKQR